MLTQSSLAGFSLLKNFIRLFNKHFLSSVCVLATHYSMSWVIARKKQAESPVLAEEEKESILCVGQRSLLRI